MHPHNCIINACDGSDYAGLRLTCSVCQSFVYLQCILEEPQIQYLMVALEIAEYNGETDEDKKSYYDDHKEKLDKLLGGSFIQFMCHKCIYSTLKNTPFDNSKVNTKGGGGHKSTYVPENDNEQKKTNKMKNVKQNAGSFEMYVAKFDLNTTTDDIVQRIVASINDIDVKMFSVQKVGGTRKFHTFSSFKITTTNYDVCVEILSMNWDGKTAEMFTKKNPNPNPPRREQQNKSPNHPNKVQRDNRYFREHRPYHGNRNPYEHRNQSDYHNRRDDRERYEYREYRDRRGDPRHNNNNNRNQQDNREHHDRGYNSNYRNSYRRKNNNNNNLLDDFLYALQRIMPNQRNTGRR